MSNSTCNVAVTASCQRLRSELGATAVILPSDSQYSALREENWSQTTWQHPICIAIPGSAVDVQKLVSELAANEIPFAVRSGGHSPNPFDANIDVGVLIALNNLDEVTYHDETGLASIGPGARWDAVYTALDPYNVTVVGGRVMDVGVGGLILGGGLSYLSDLYGLACDNVQSFEVILADGSVVEASSKDHSDMFWALKGGANNFGIVTKFTVTTYPIKDAWGGVQIFTLDQMPDLLQAYYEYQTTPDKDLYANLVINLVPTQATVMLTLIYLKPVERPAAYAPFYKLSPVADQTGFATLHELMGAFPTPEIPRWTWYTSSFKPDSDLLSEISALLVTAPEKDSIAALRSGTLVATMQPISQNVILAGQERGGGNALGLRSVNQTWFALNVGWWGDDDDDVAYASIESLHGKVNRLTAADVHHAALEYIFMNDANAKQPVIASYGDQNVRRLHTVQQAYDPSLVFQKLVPGGQKMPPL